MRNLFEKAATAALAAAILPLALAILVIAVFGAPFPAVHAQVALQITPAILPNASVGVPYSETLSASTATGGPFLWNINSGALPPGLSIDTGSTRDTIALSGTPTTAGTFTFTVGVTNHVLAATQTYIITVAEASSTVTNAPSTTPTFSPAPAPITAPIPATIPTPIAAPAPTNTPTAPTATASSATPDELRAELDQLTTQLAQLENEVASRGSVLGATTLGATTANCGSATFCRDLTIGSQGSDVHALQAFLNANGAPLAQSGPGSLGEETDYFGSLTKAALAQWQAANSISPASGYFGPKTRAFILAANASGTYPSAP